MGSGNRRGTLLPSRWLRRKISMSANELRIVSHLPKGIKWAPQNVHQVDCCSAHTASFHSVLMACDKLQNCPLYLHRGSSNRVQPEASAFCSALLKAVVPHKCGWLTTVMKFPINTYIIRSSCSTFKRFMYPKKNTAFCGVLRPPSNGDTFCKIQAATLIMHDIHI